MKKLFDQLKSFLFRDKRLSINEGVEHSLRKYKKTYKLLEEYDKKDIGDPEVLAESGRLQPYIRELQKKSRVRRADSRV